MNKTCHYSSYLVLMCGASTASWCKLTCCQCYQISFLTGAGIIRDFSSIWGQKLYILPSTNVLLQIFRHFQIKKKIVSHNGAIGILYQHVSWPIEHKWTALLTLYPALYENKLIFLLATSSCPVFLQNPSSHIVQESFVSLDQDLSQLLATCSGAPGQLLGCSPVGWLIAF